MATGTGNAIKPKQLIIDTDPGVDDAMAIFLAFQSPELEVIGITTTFGNVPTTLATENALRLCEMASREDIPVAEGLHMPLKAKSKGKEHAVAFIHGEDGLGNTYPPLPKKKAIDIPAPEFLVRKAQENPGQITLVALGPLTNVAKAVEMDSCFAQNVAQIIILGGAFSVNGNVNPAAEANVLNDPEAADIVFNCGADILVIGINITHQVVLTGNEIDQLGRCGNRTGKVLHDIIMCYLNYHREAYSIDAIYLHDPATMVAAIDPSLFTYAEGVVRVQQDGICRGLTIFNNTKKIWPDVTEWCNKPSVKVATTVDADRVVTVLSERLMAAI